VLGSLRQIREFYKSNGKSLSRATLCAALVREMRQSWGEQVQVALYIGDAATYRFLFDIDMGLAGTVSRVILAEEEIAGKTQDLISEGVATIGELANVPISKQSEEFLAISQETKTGADLLIEDPSGFSLVDAYIEELEAREETLAPEKAYMVAGAKHAAALYKLAYAISAKLDSQN